MYRRAGQVDRRVKGMRRTRIAGGIGMINKFFRVAVQKTRAPDTIHLPGVKGT